MLNIVTLRHAYGTEVVGMLDARMLAEATDDEDFRQCVFEATGQAIDALRRKAHTMEQRLGPRMARTTRAWQDNARIARHLEQLREDCEAW